MENMSNLFLSAHDGGVESFTDSNLLHRHKSLVEENDNQIEVGENLGLHSDGERRPFKFKNILQRALMAVTAKRNEILYERCPTCKQHLKTMQAKSLVKTLQQSILKSLGITIQSPGSENWYADLQIVQSSGKKRFPQNRPSAKKKIVQTFETPEKWSKEKKWKCKLVKKELEETVKDNVRTTFLKQSRREKTKVPLKITLRSAGKRSKRNRKNNSLPSTSSSKSSVNRMPSSRSRSDAIVKHSSLRLSRPTSKSTDVGEKLNVKNNRRNLSSRGAEDEGILIPSDMVKVESEDNVRDSHDDVDLGESPSVDNKSSDLVERTEESEQHSGKSRKTSRARNCKVGRRGPSKMKILSKMNISKRNKENPSQIIETGKDVKELHQCSHCSRSFQSERGKILHENTHRDQVDGKKSQVVCHVCETCGKSFKRKECLKRHKRSHVKKCHMCRYCSKTFSDRKDLLTHERTHTGERPYACKLCNMTFAAQSSYSRHLTLHTGIKPFLCEQCGKAFKTKSELKRHGMTHTAERPFKCELCEKCFTSKNNMVSHRLTHTGEKPYACSVCNKTFTRHFLLTIHMRIHTGEKPYKCPHCLRTFAQNSNFRKHLKVHTISEKLKGKRSFSCDICHKSFFSEGKLGLHLDKHARIDAWKQARQAELEARAVECDICHQKFTNTRSLHRHKRVHSGKWPYICKVCGKGCNYKRELDVHIRSHTGEKPFVCSECPKTFAKKLLLTMHMRIHTGERPYKCSQCPRTFTQSSNLKKHIRNRHALKPSVFREGYSIAFCYAPSTPISQPPAQTTASGSTPSQNVLVSCVSNSSDMPSTSSNTVQSVNSVPQNQISMQSDMNSKNTALQNMQPNAPLQQDVEGRAQPILSRSYDPTAYFSRPPLPQHNGAVHQILPQIPLPSSSHPTQAPLLLQFPPHSMDHPSIRSVTAQLPPLSRAQTTSIPQHCQLQHTNSAGAQLFQYTNHQSVRIMHAVNGQDPINAHSQHTADNMIPRNVDFPQLSKPHQQAIHPGGHQIIQQHPLNQMSHPHLGVSQEHYAMIPHRPNSGEASYSATLQASEHMPINRSREQFSVGYKETPQQIVQHSMPQPPDLQAVPSNMEIPHPETVHHHHHVKEASQPQSSSSSRESRVIECQVCHRRFNDIRSLHRHERLHTGVWPFTCDICGKGCSYRGELERHQRGHTGEKPHACEVCGKDYALPRSLKRHMETAHKDTSKS